MKIGVPKEIKVLESRIALTPKSVKEFIDAGHEVFVEKTGGIGSGFSDSDYTDAGASILDSAEEVWSRADMIIKVKEPLEQEYPLMRPGKILFTYLHLAANLELAQALQESGITAIAYETVTDSNGKLPLLIPMSEIAGRLSILVGSQYVIQNSKILPGGITGVEGTKVVIIGGGTSGEHAARNAVGLGADVTVLDLVEEKLISLKKSIPGLKTAISTPETLAEKVKEADLIIGAVLVPGNKAPKVVSNNLVSQAKPGSVFVDIAIDQGGCFEDSHATTHTDPVFKVHDSTFYCVANMPGIVAKTATEALNHSTLPFALKIANDIDKALADDPGLRNGLAVKDGEIVDPIIKKLVTV